MTMTKVYISGPISSDPDYKGKFAAVAEKLKELGLEPVSPTGAPEGLSYRQYIDSGLDLLMGCDMICMLPGSIYSQGAMLEQSYAQIVNVPILMAKLINGEYIIKGSDGC
jgi:hypothetical protein